MHSFLSAAHIASDFTCVYSAAAGTICGTTDVFELTFSYTFISIFKYGCKKNIMKIAKNCMILEMLWIHNFSENNLTTTSTNYF